MSLALAGEVWALSRLTDLARASLLKDIKERRQASSVVLFTDGAGRKRRMKTAHSRPQRDEATGEVTSWQLVLAWDMDAEALNALLLDLQRSHREAGQRVAAVRELLDVLARHPECATAREAWLADGRRLDEIDLSA